MTTVRGSTGKSHLALKPGAKRHANVLSRCGHWVLVAVVLPGDQPSCISCQRLLSKP